MVDHIQRKLASKCVSVSPNVLFLEQLADYEEIPEGEWDIPLCFQERMLAELLADEYSNNRTLEENATQFLNDHGAIDCHIARGMIGAGGALDQAIIRDRIKGVLNKTTFEYLGREYYGLKMAFLPCRAKDDWRRPRNSREGWKSKVDWDA